MAAPDIAGAALPPAGDFSSLAGKVVVVTGAGTGIGAAIAAGFVAAGARVSGFDVEWDSDVRQPSGLEQIDCNVANAGAVECRMAEVVKKHGDVEILVNNAAIATALKLKPFEQITADEWTNVVGNNTLAPFLCSRAVAPGMRSRKRGRIINLSSGVIYSAAPEMMHYVASKGAIAALTRAMAKELGSDGITVNAVAPGLTITQGIERNSDYSKEMRAQMVAARCLPREERAEDLVGTCLFLASDGAAFITGQILVIDGGGAFP